jgi:hypothetical protein
VIGFSSYLSDPDDWKKYKEEIREVLSKRVGQYSGLLIRSVVFKQGELWRNLITRIETISKDEAVPKDETLNFDDIIAAKRFIQVRARLRLIAFSSGGLSVVPFFGGL